MSINKTVQWPALSASCGLLYCGINTIPFNMATYTTMHLLKCMGIEGSVIIGYRRALVYIV